jgi:hypothetical protein
MPAERKNELSMSTALQQTNNALVKRDDWRLRE